MQNHAPVHLPLTTSVVGKHALCKQVPADKDDCLLGYVSTTVRQQDGKRQRKAVRNIGSVRGRKRECRDSQK